MNTNEFITSEWIPILPIPRPWFLSCFKWKMGCASAEFLVCSVLDYPKMDWIEEQCQDIENNMKKNNSKKTYQLVKDLTSTKQGRTTTIQDKDGKCLTEEQDILKRWTEYCSELYNYRATGDPEVINVPPATDNDNYPILREEVEAAVKSLKKGKSAGADNVPAELVQAGGEAMISALLTICNKIWQTGE